MIIPQILFFASLTLVQSFNIRGRIANGNDAEPHSAPYIVSIQVETGPGKYHHSCGGAIIDSNWILTAAHCLHNDDTVYKLLIKGGRHYIKSETEESAQHRKISYYKNHEKYPGDVAPYDIALIYVEEPFEWTNAVQPIRLPLKANVAPTDFARLYGWGLLTENGNFPEVLQTARLPIIPLDICMKNEIYGDVVHETNICTIDPAGMSACSSDSGGPLVKTNNNDIDGESELVGIVSWGTPCGRTNNKSVSVFVQVSSFLDWINEVKSNFENGKSK